MQHKGVLGVLLLTFKDEGSESSDEARLPIIVKNTFANAQDGQIHGVKLSSLAIQARNLIRDLDPSNDLTFVRIMTENTEYLVAPDKDYFLVVVQNVNADQSE